jgi:short subunit dehydrogenase-like uncharacterized protein
MNAKSYDVIVFGATSFVGKLLCRYFASHFNPGELKWAAAGRSIEKLELMRRSLDRRDSEIPLIIADARDERSLSSRRSAPTLYTASLSLKSAWNSAPITAI